MVKKITKRLFVTFFLVFVVVFLATCLSPFLNPARWWHFGFFGLLFPYCLILMLFFLLYWSLKKSKWSILVLLCLAVGWKSVGAAFAFNIGSGFDMEKPEERIRIMTWNMRFFIGPTERISKSGISADHQKMFDLIGNYNPDILTIQEFTSSESGRYANNLEILTTEMGFKYYFFAPHGSSNGNKQAEKKTKGNGIIILSKLSIINTDIVDLPSGLGTTEGVIYADISTGKDTIRVFAGHLQSFGFMGKDYQDINKIKNDPDERLDASKSIVRKMRVAFQFRGKQADRIREEMDRSKYPEIFCADLNDVPNSYTYFTIRGNKKDAFIEKGLGFGKTFYSLFSGFMRRLPFLRIDYILTDPQFTIHQTKAVGQVLSDHIPVVTDLSLQK
ncbi:MAG: endonuclease/exonuclease/phosphatase family protein [Chitinophagaceae bacterium]|nr:endonuclease/exonuclease/phosphatase family protein [Chitinophagaceae bacterium]MCW5926165.1 endonuclease/exonuclease/phosphatase family protein [Chitinophagaceae bacterium]